MRGFLSLALPEAKHKIEKDLGHIGVCNTSSFIKI